MRKLQSDVVLPFLKAHHRFIEVLVTKFTLKRTRRGFRLSVAFNNKNLAVWSDLGKREVQRKIPAFKTLSEKYQRELDDFLITGKEPFYLFNDSKFPFRFASGGTLPIIRRGHKEYYGFFYRDIEPIGWNIANGGCDSLHELFNPIETIERELREELVAFNCIRRKWLLFEAGEGEIAARPEFLNIRGLLAKQYPRLQLGEFGIDEIPLKWLDGPDELQVTFGNRDEPKVSGCFLNINAKDFGIEIDRIAWITIDPETVLYDGESWGSTLVNSPVGLFEVDRFNDLVKSESTHFLPDIFFYDARCYNEGKKHIKIKVENYVKRMVSKRPYPFVKAYRQAQAKFDMCPATRGIVLRYLSTLDVRPKDKFDIFISFCSRDEQLARRIFKYLKKNTNKRIFFSAETIHDGNWSRQVAQALESARKLILVGTSVKNIMESHVEYEWRAFHLLSISESKRRILVPVMVGVDPKTLPLPLRLFQGYFPKNENQLQSVLPKLL